MLIADAQREVRSVYVGGVTGLLTSAALWSLSAALGTWGSTRQAIIVLVSGGALDSSGGAAPVAARRWTVVDQRGEPDAAARPAGRVGDSLVHAARGRRDPLQPQLVLPGALMVAVGAHVDAQGNVYGAVVRRQMLERHVKK